MKNQIFQYREPKRVQKGKDFWDVSGVYLLVKNVASDMARCKVILIKSQAKLTKFKLNSYVNVPVTFLTVPDLFPTYSKHQFRWLNAVHDPIIDVALKVTEEIIEENKKNPRLLIGAAYIPTMDTMFPQHTVLSLREVLSALTKKDFAVGQIWKTKDNTYTIFKKWDTKYIVKNKFGDHDAYSLEELLELLKNAKLTTSFDKKAITKAIAIILSPFLGATALVLLLKLIENLLD